MPDTAVLPDNPIEADLDDESFVYQSIGRASVCWVPMEGSGIFDEAMARTLSEGILARMARPRLELANLNELCEEVARRNGDGED